MRVTRRWNGFSQPGTDALRQAPSAAGADVILVSVSRERTPFGRQAGERHRGGASFSQPGTDALRQVACQVAAAILPFQSAGNGRPSAGRRGHRGGLVSQPGTDAPAGSETVAVASHGFSQPGTDALRQACAA